MIERDQSSQLSGKSVSFEKRKIILHKKCSQKKKQPPRMKLRRRKPTKHSVIQFKLDECEEEILTASYTSEAIKVIAQKHLSKRFLPRLQKYKAKIRFWHGRELHLADTISKAYPTPSCQNSQRSDTQREVESIYA